MLFDEDAIVADIRAHGYHIAEGAIPDELVRPAYRFASCRTRPPIPRQSLPCSSPARPLLPTG